MTKLYGLLAILGVSIVLSSALISAEKCTVEDRQDVCDKLGCNVVNKTCEPCMQGGYCGAAFDCEANDSGGECVRKSLFDGWFLGSSFNVGFIFIGAALAAGGGVGGGGIFVPLYVLVLGLSTKEAVPLSTATIAGSSIANMWVYLHQKHPIYVTEPLINFGSILMLSPMLLTGTIFGVMGNIIFPSWLILAMLALTLCFAFFRTYGKGRDRYEQESAKKERARLAGRRLSVAAVVPSSCYVPSFEGAIIAAVWVLVCGFSFLRGGKGGTTSLIGVKPCSTWYWVLTFVVVIALTVLTAISGHYLMHMHDEESSARLMDDHSNPQVAPAHGLQMGGDGSVQTAASAGIDASHDDDDDCESGNSNKNGAEITWDSHTVLLYPCISFIAGLLGGLLGIGGGMIMGPLLLELGLSSASVSATSACAVFLTASAATVQFIVFDSLLVDYAIFYSVVGFIATVIGLHLIKKAVQRSGRSSIIVFCIALVIFVAMIMMLLSGTLRIVEDIKEDRDIGFSGLC